MNHIEFIQDFAVVMMVAGFVTILFRQLKQPVVLGYIIAGLIVGPYTPPFAFVNDDQTIHIMADMGVVFLMFSLGLHFNLRQLQRVGKTALTAATVEILLMVLIGYSIGWAWGWNLIDSLFLGAILSISSTTIIAKALHELNLSKERFSELTFGVLIVEDILAVIMLTLLSSIALTDTLTWQEIWDTSWHLVLLLAILLGVGRFLLPPIMRYVESFHSNEAKLIIALGLCCSSALLASALGYSEALGAFLMGALLSDIPEISPIDPLIEPVRDVFSALFFVSVGMLIDPKMMWQYRWIILALVLVVILGKIITCTLGARLAGNDWGTSFKVGMALTQIGEFSFIIATLGMSLHVTSDFLYPIAVSVSAITTLTTPYLIKFSHAIVKRPLYNE